MNEIGQKLREFGNENFASLKEFARALGVHPSNLQAYLNGQREPGTPFLRKLKLLGCNLDWLFNESESYLVNEPEINRYSPKNEYPVHGIIPAGKGEVVDLTDWIETEVLDYDPSDHAILIIDEEFGYSMSPVIQPGDQVLYSYSARVMDGDPVVARWDRTKGAMKICNYVDHDPSLIALSSSNIAVPPIILKKNKVIMYKVVLIIKKSKR